MELLKMENEEKQTDYFKEVQVNITKVEVNVGLDNCINKITFHIGEKKITWKPKIDDSKDVDGITVTSRKPMPFKSLPDKVKEIAKKAKSNGACPCVVEYTQMTTDNGAYYYITSAAQLERWELL